MPTLEGQDLTRIATSQKVVALTFDAGANADAVAPILTTLRRGRRPCGGRCVGSNPDDRSILDADALPAIISGYRAKGYSFVTLDVLLS